MTSSSFWRSAIDPERVAQIEVVHWQEQQCTLRPEQVTIEEPLEIQVGGRSLAIIMRTPGHDRELALGFLLAEGIITCAEDVVEVTYGVDKDGLPLENVVQVSLSKRDGLEPRVASFERHFTVSASCGVCGKNSIADLLQNVPSLEVDTFRIEAAIVYTLADQLRGQQAVFRHTGGLHAAGLFERDGGLTLLREDIGRHNAVDKLVGHNLLQKTFPLRERLLLVSGRTSYEIVQKALLARIPCVAAISAPSSLAVELAEKGGITLIGFLREQGMNVYTHPQRIVKTSL